MVGVTFGLEKPLSNKQRWLYNVWNFLGYTEQEAGRLLMSNPIFRRKRILYRLSNNS